MSIISANGFTVNSVTVVDGGSQIVFTFSGFDAGEKLVFSVDADEAQFVGGGDVDANALVEGAEFQRSIMTGKFSAPDYVDLTLTGTYWDAFDGNFAAAQTATGLTLDLPNDALLADPRLHRPHGRRGRPRRRRFRWPRSPAGSTTTADDDGIFDTATEAGHRRRDARAARATAIGTGITTTTSNEPGKVGFYEFIDLMPGTYGVREVQPAGWLDGKDTAGGHGGAAAARTTASPARCSTTATMA